MAAVAKVKDVIGDAPFVVATLAVVGNKAFGVSDALTRLIGVIVTCDDGVD